MGASASTLLSSAEFICLRVVYRKVFWEELSRPIWTERSTPRLLLFALSTRRFGCSFQSKLFSISKLLCLLFFAFENCVPFLISLRCSWKNFPRRYNICFAHASHQLIQVRIVFRVNCTREVFALQARTFYTQTSVSYCTLLLSRKSYTLYIYLYSAVISSTCGWRQTGKLLCTEALC